MTFMKKSVVLALSAGAMTVGATAQDSVVREETQFEDWIVQCVTEGENPRQCAAITRAQSAAGDRDLAIVSVQVSPPSEEGEPVSDLTAFLTTPTNVLIPPGVVIEIDQAAIATAVYQACTQQNCQAALPLGEGIVSGMTNGLGAALVLTDIQGVEQRAILSLSGFTAAVDRLLEG